MRRRRNGFNFLYLFIILALAIALRMLTVTVSEQSAQIENYEAELERYQSIIQVQDQNIRELQEQINNHNTNIETYRLELQELQDILNQLTVQKFTATAYTHVAVPGVADINGTGDGITRSGLPVSEGLIAVDPRVIPLGTKVWVDGYGVLLAADTGGAIKGKRIDIFFDSRQEAMNFGRQDVTVRWVKL